jgi:hypothetical protein
MIAQKSDRNNDRTKSDRNNDRRPREFENCMNEPPTEKAQKACPGTCESDLNDCKCVAAKQSKSCTDLHGSNEKAKLDCLTKPAAAHILEQCPKKKISF